MIRQILIGFAAATVIILIILWLITGGPKKVADYARQIGNPIDYIFFSGTSSAGYFKLPWQPDLNVGAKLYEIPDDTDTASSPEPSPQPESLSSEEEIAQTQKKYDALVKETEAARTFGEPSPERGRVHLQSGTASEGPVSKEYLEIEADGGNTAPVNVSGWSVQSALTGVRAYIPRGTNSFVLGSVNQQSDTYLDPEATAILATSPSPLGTSFRENLCTGYLGRMQTFTPSLSSNCPSPGESLPLTPDNLRTYGDACFDFVQSLPPCKFPREAPPEITPACHIFLSNTLSYNGCVQRYAYRADFLRSSWRIYLNAGGELWRNTHDIIRLLDKAGRTVDVVSY